MFFNDLLAVVFSFADIYGIVESTMSFPPHLPEPVYEFVDKVKAVLGSFFDKVVEKAEELRLRAQFVIDKVTGGLPPGKQRAVLIGLGGVLAVLLAVIVGMALPSKKQSAEQDVATTNAKSVDMAPAQQGIIPPEELFLPEEPDFVPGVILEREQRTMWAAGDAAPLWQDPLRNGEEPWRDRLEKAIDEILESVP